MKYLFQRVEKELQEKAESAQLPAKREEARDGGETGVSSGSSERHKREAGDKARETGVLAGDRLKNIKKKAVSLQQKVKTLYDTLKDYRDAKGRQLSLIFLKLPSKHEYPDYYDIIKRPIDLEKISSKIRNNQYETMEDAVADFTLVFDNAAKYNEPDSQIYKDAQTLARLAHQTVRHITEDGDGIPDARAAVALPGHLRGSAVPVGLPMQPPIRQDGP